MPDPPFDWHEYLTLAQDLGRRPEESSLRSSISRAYYYVYHLALTRAEQNGFRPTPGESTHAQLWRLFHKSPEPACINLGQLALRLKEKRERADYRPIYRRIEQEVPDALADADEFGTRLGILPARHPNPGKVRR